MDQELVTLAESGAAVLVGAMATDLWRSVKDGTLAVFRRLGPDRRRAVAEQLDRNAELVRGADRPEDARQALFAFWALELAALLHQDPDTAPDLARLVAAHRGEQQRLSYSQHNTAHDRGAVYAVQHGDQRVVRAADEQP
ncbi:hypothetical protein [Kitasatospora cheerisanensis]|uniref:Uncharacterized protein n=1 Tax=Kitasatospora cheerisanensis KCTC 2395 TaxID=1348663 RepID=A0A066YQJ6_9ACTN|nr:hypothetical protein [Kitasatospora cheerisanensis]KDN82244.1 hypothetical protein KCH_59530 [Kitasatospora cheerisanensis KCTC 2395]